MLFRSLIEPEVRELRREASSDGIETIVCRSEPGVEITLELKAGAANRGRFLVLDLAGAAHAAADPLVRALVEGGATVCRADLRVTGRHAIPGDTIAAAPDHNSAEWSIWVGRPLLGQWIVDAAAAAATMRKGTSAGEADELTVIGIGDMSGDVFGNGLLRSRHVKLIAAFDHRHVFIDPDPDPSVSFDERSRMFALPRSSWADYDTSLLSEGGGVYARSLKSIELSPQACKRLGVERSTFTPNELISAILRSPVDLLWNGGIGTYVKATGESHADVGDRANDGVRVNGGELRCRMVGEGGNLGFTQRARVEYALTGGLINTDAIDNSAGVDCSDHEVNIKILLGAAVAAGRLDLERRNALLAEMTDEVGELVLDDNRAQTLALTIARRRALPMVNVHARYQIGRAHV
mgnify:CR=1 FL=1